jgi:GNAT superfamily N-acetyltransferase
MPPLAIHPLTPDRWGDLETLFGPNGANSGCWCMWWRVTSAEFSREAGQVLHDMLQALADEGPPPGLLAYDGDRPVGWLSLGPRSDFGRLQRSRKLAPVDDRPAWGVVCLYIGRRERGKGVASALVAGAVDYARSQGVEVLEGYPIDTGPDRVQSGSIFTGTIGMFAGAGFIEVERREGRPIMRLELT